MGSVERAAYHEAGHAVVRIRLRLSVLGATVVPGQGAGGHVTVNPWNIKKASLSRLINEGVAAYAGSIAEERHTGYRNDEGAGRPGKTSLWPSLAEGSDYHTVAGIALHVTSDGQEQEALVRWLRRRAEVYVDREWGRIESVARALLERQTLTRRNIVALM
jgi:hypothetical protein